MSSSGAQQTRASGPFIAPPQRSTQPPPPAPKPSGCQTGLNNPVVQLNAQSPAQRSPIRSVAAHLSRPSSRTPSASLQPPVASVRTNATSLSATTTSVALPAGRSAVAAASKSSASPPAPSSKPRAILLWTSAQIFYLLWLVPATALIVLNLKGHIIGASAWCPYGKCNINVMVPASAWQKANRFGSNNHNLLGVLQLVAKALEVWFVSITVALAYKMTMRLACSAGGLPLAYLTRPNGLTEISALIQPILWSIPRATASSSSVSSRPRTGLLYLFLTLTAILCILCNLMGPAVAVLILPTLQWRKADNISDGYFSGMLSDEPPIWGNVAAQAIFGQCNTPDMPYRLNCSERTGWDQTFANSLQSLDSASPSFVISAGGVSIFTNLSTGGRGEGITAYWVPSRQTVSQIAGDTGTIAGMESNSYGYAIADTDNKIMPQFNKSLEMQLLRTGPIVGSYVNVWAGNGVRIRTTVVDASRQVRCYEGYLAGVLPRAASTLHYNPGTRCIQVGAGWGADTKSASFSVAVRSNVDSATNTTVLDVNIYSSGRTTFWPKGERPTGVGSDCFGKVATDSAQPTTTTQAPSDVSVIPLSGCVPLQDPDMSDENGLRQGCTCEGVVGLLPFFRDHGSDLCDYTALTVTGTSTATVATQGQNYGPQYTPWHTISSACDWPSFWGYNYDPPIPGMDVQSNVTTIEMTLRQDNMTSTLAVDFNAFYDTVTYSLDPSYLDHPSLWAQTLSEPQIAAAMHLDPSWVLAAWSVSNGSVLTSDSVAGQVMYDQLRTLLDGQKDGYTSDLDFSHGWAYEDYASIVKSPIVLPPVLQILSMLDYWTTPSDQPLPHYTERRGETLLWHSGRIYVWAYGMGSRTATLGVTVVIAGMLVVLAQFLMSLTRRMPSKDLTQFLAAALAQPPHGEFDHTKNDPDKIAATGFRVEHSHTQIGNLEFSKVP